MAIRWGNCARPVFNVKQTSAQAAPGLQPSQNRIAAIWASSAGAVLALRVNKWHDLSAAGEAVGMEVGSSSTTCALIPLIPKELTPAIRRVPGIAPACRGHDSR